MKVSLLLLRLEVTSYKVEVPNGEKMVDRNGEFNPRILTH